MPAASSGPVSGVGFQPYLAAAKPSVNGPGRHRNWQVVYSQDPVGRLPFAVSKSEHHHRKHNHILIATSKL